MAKRAKQVKWHCKNGRRRRVEELCDVCRERRRADGAKIKKRRIKKYGLEVVRELNRKSAEKYRANHGGRSYKQQVFGKREDRKERANPIPWHCKKAYAKRKDELCEKCLQRRREDGAATKRRRREWEKEQYEMQSRISSENNVKGGRKNG